MARLCTTKLQELTVIQKPLFNEGLYYNMNMTMLYYLYFAAIHGGIVKNVERMQSLKIIIILSVRRINIGWLINF